MNGPEGFLPKKQIFTMQVAQVLWDCPFSVLVAGVSGQQPVCAGVHEAALPPQQHRHLLLHRPHRRHQSGKVRTLTVVVNGMKHKPCPILKVSEVTVRNKSFGNPHNMRLPGQVQV